MYNKTSTYSSTSISAYSYLHVYVVFVLAYVLLCFVTMAHPVSLVYVRTSHNGTYGHTEVPADSAHQFPPSSCSRESTSTSICMYYYGSSREYSSEFVPRPPLAVLLDSSSVRPPLNSVCPERSSPAKRPTKTIEIDRKLDNYCGFTLTRSTLINAHHQPTCYWAVAPATHPQKRDSPAHANSAQRSAARG